MKMFNWFRQLRSRKISAGRAAKTLLPPPRFRPWLEGLEDRMVPTTFFVDVATDNLTAPAVNSLRWAVNKVNADTDIQGSEIVFAKALVTQPIQLLGTLEIMNTVARVSMSPSKLITVTRDAAAVGTFSLFTIDAGTIVSMHTMKLTGGISDDGGAIYNAGTLGLGFCTISNNTASGCGGGIYNTNKLTISATDFRENKTTFGDGGAIWNKGDIIMSGGSMVLNEAYGNGGAINNAAGGTVTIKQMQALTRNKALHGNGGGIANFSQKPNAVNLNLVALRSNEAIADADLPGISGLGGGLYNAGQALLTNCDIEMNKALGGAGIKKMPGSDTILKGMNRIKDDVSSIGGGGGITVDAGATFITTGSQLTGNTANGLASDLFVQGTATMQGGNTIGTLQVAGGTTTLTGASSFSNVYVTGGLLDKIGGSTFGYLDLTGGEYNLDGDGTLVDTGNYDQTSGGTLALTLTSVSAFDQLTVGGIISPNGTLTINIPASATINPGNTFVIIKNLGGSLVDGNFIGLPEGAPVFSTNGQYEFTISYNVGSGHDVVLTNVAQATTTSLVSDNPSGSVFGQAVTFTATVAVNAPGTGTPTGTVIFTDAAGNQLGSGTLDGSGTASFSTTSLPLGTSSITASYSGASNFISSSASTSQTVNQANTTTALTSSTNPSVFGQTLTFTATVGAAAPGAGMPTGTVSFVDNNGNVFDTETLVNGQATSSGISALALGNDTITANYSGDTNFINSSGNTSQTVNQAATTTALTANSNGSVVGQAVTFTASVSVNAPGMGTPTGSVSFVDNNGNVFDTETLVYGHATSSGISTLAVGSDTIAAVYNGDSNFTSSSGSTSQTVNEAATSTSLASNANPAVFGQTITFTASVSVNAPGSGTPTGTVAFSDGATFLGNGTLDGYGNTTFTTANLAVTGHTITAVYLGDSNFITSSGGTNQTVNEAATSTSLTSDIDPSVYGQTVTFTATVSVNAPGTGTATGTVAFEDGSSFLGDGTLDGFGIATYTTANLAVTGHTITAVYLGDGNYDISSGSTSLTVNEAATTTSLTSDINPSVYGQTVTFTATVSVNAPGTGTATGNVAFEDGSVFLSDGTLDSYGNATYTTANLAVTGHTITAVYLGDGNYDISSGSTSLTVNEAATSTSLTSDINPSVFGQTVTFTASVSVNAPGTGTATGNVAFEDGATFLGDGTLDGYGNATYTTANLAVTGHTITAVYLGDGNYAISSGSTSLTVNEAATTTSLTSDSNPSVFGQTVTFTANVSVNAPGTGTATGTVAFQDGATFLGDGTLDGYGNATFTTANLAVTGHTITAVYLGDGNYAISSGSTSLTVNEAATSTSLTSDINPSVFGQTVTFTASVSVNGPGSGTATGTVSFVDSNGNVLDTETLVNGQAASIGISTLAVGSDTIAAVYSGDGNFTMSSGSTNQTVNQAATSSTLTSDTSPAVFGQTVTFTATVSVNAPGAALPTGTVTFYDGSSVLGSGTLDSSGRATFSTSALNVGDHVITAIYSGDGDCNTSSSAGLTQTIATVDTSSSVVSSVNPAVFGQQVTFTATVSANATGAATPTGTVTFYDGSSAMGTGTLSNGNASLSIDTLSAGCHSITVAFSTNDVFNGSTSAALSQTVYPSGG